MRRFVLFAAAGWLILSTGAPSFAETTATYRSVVSEGVGVILGWNHQRARSQALKEALKKSLFLVMRDYLLRKDYISHYTIIRENIYPYYKRYIQTYKLIDEHREGRLYRISVRTVVNVNALLANLIALKVTARRRDRPLLSIRLVELNDNLSPDKPFQLFRSPARRKDKAEPGKWVQFIPPMEIFFPHLLDETVAARFREWGGGFVRSSQADLLLEIKGFGLAKGASEKTLSSYQAIVVLKALSLPGNQVPLFESSATAEAYHQELQLSRKYAFVKAAREASVKLIDQLSPFYHNQLFEKNTVELVVEGVNDRQLSLLMDGLNLSVEGIDPKHVITHSFAHGTARIELRISQTPYRLAEELKKKDFPQFNLILEEYNQERLNFRYVAKGSLPPDRRDGRLLGLEESS